MGFNEIYAVLCNVGRFLWTSVPCHRPGAAHGAFGMTRMMSGRPTVWGSPPGTDQAAEAFPFKWLQKWLCQEAGMRGASVAHGFKSGSPGVAWRPRWPKAC